MKAIWTCVLVFATAATLSASQYSYSNSAGIVSQTTTTLTITGSTLSSPEGTVSMSCNLTPITTGFGFTEEWSCTGGSFTLQSTDGKTSINGVFSSGIFTYTQSEVNRVFY
jgi:hypothetical protein